MHLGTRVIEVADFKSEVRLDLRGHLEAIMRSEERCRCLNHLKEAFTGQRSMGTLIIEATELKSEVRFGLRGHLEATMASEAS